MSKQTETLKLALEALEGLEALLLSMGLTYLIVYGDAEKAITALREALAEQPAPSQYGSPELQAMIVARAMEKNAAEQPAQQEPVAWIDEYGNAFPLAAKQYSIVGKHWKPLYTSPQPIKPLTDEEILSVARNHYNPHERAEISFARAIEAAHGIKENT